MGVLARWALAPAHQAIVFAQAFALPEVARTCLVQAHHAIHRAREHHPDEAEGAEAAIGQQHVILFQPVEHPAGEMIFLIVMVAKCIAQHRPAAQTEKADHAQQREAAAGFLALGLRPALLILARVGHGKAGAIEHLHAPPQPSLAIEDAPLQRGGQHGEEFSEHAQRHPGARLAVSRGARGHLLLGSLPGLATLTRPMPPCLKLAHHLPARAGR
jgi:hypothetical protein